MVTFQLRRTEASDLPVLLGWVPTWTDMVLWSGTTFHWPLDLDQLTQDLDTAAESGRILWTAVQSDGLPIGHASLTTNDDGTIGRFGRVLINPLKRLKGYGRPLVGRSVEAGFEETGVDLMTLGVYEHNRATRALYSELGFEETGIVFDTEVEGGTRRLIEMSCERTSFHLPGSSTAQG